MIVIVRSGQTMNYSKIINHKLSDAIDAYYFDQVRNPQESYYFYYLKPVGNDLVGSFKIAKDKPGQDWIIGSKSKICASKSKTQIFHSLRDVVGTLPILKSD